MITGARTSRILTQTCSSALAPFRYVRPHRSPGRACRARTTKDRKRLSDATLPRSRAAARDRAERTDEEIAVEEIGGEDLAVIHSDDWRRITQIPGLLSLVLDRAERGGLMAVNELLDLYGVGQAHTPAMLRYLE